MSFRPEQTIQHRPSIGSGVDKLFHLYQICQDPPERFEVRRSNLPVPLHDVIHTAVGEDDVEPHVPLFFRGELGFLYRRDGLLLESGV